MDYVHPTGGPGEPDTPWWAERAELLRGLQPAAAMFALGAVLDGVGVRVMGVGVAVYLAAALVGWWRW